MSAEAWIIVIVAAILVGTLVYQMLWTHWHAKNLREDLEKRQEIYFDARREDR